METRWRSPPESMDGYFPVSRGKADQPQQLAGVRTSLLLVAGAEAQLRAEQHVVERGAPRHEPRRLKHEGDLRPGLGGRAAVDPHPSRADIEQAADDAQRRRLAAAGRPENANKLAPPHVEAQPIINLVVAKPDADIVETR